MKEGRVVGPLMAAVGGQQGPFGSLFGVNARLDCHINVLSFD